MTGMTKSSSGLDIRRRKALYRAWHRGLREIDLMLGTYAERELAGMDDSGLASFEALLEETDSDLLAWITGQTGVPEHVDAALLERIRQNYLQRAG